MGAVVQGAAYAAGVIVLQLALAQLLGGIEPGARAQGVGAAVSALLMIGAGLTIGLRRRAAGDAERPSASIEAEPALLGDGAAISRTWHWQAVATAAVLSIVGLLTYFLGGLEALMPSNAAAPSGVGRAMFAADAVVLVGLVLVNLGYALGVNAPRGALRSSAVGYAVFVGIAVTLGYIARFVSYEATTIASTAAAGFGAAALITGFGVAWFRRRMSFIELVLIALAVCFSLYLTVALGPEAWTRASNLPEEQILLALALFPVIVVVALLNVGGSLGFLLNGGGRFDPGFVVEVRVAMRYLSAQALSIIIGLGGLGINLLMAAIVAGLGWMNRLPLAAVVALAAIAANFAFLFALRRHWRKLVVGLVTMIAIGSVCLGVMSLIIVLSIMSGFEDDLKKKILGAHAHVVINKKGDDFVEYRDVAKAVRTVRGIDSSSAFVLGDAMISTDVGLSGTLVKGIDVGDAEGVADLRSTIVKGSLDNLLHPEQIPGARPRIDFGPARSPKAGSSTVAAPSFESPSSASRRSRRILPGIVIGRELAKTLRAYVGDTVKVVSPVSDEIGPMGPIPKLRRFRVAGIFYSGMYEYDAKFSYLAMEQAQRFFGVRKRATGVEVKVVDIDDTARVVDGIMRRLGGHPYSVKDWRTMNKELFSALLLEKLAMFIALGMIVMVASFLIIAVLVMIVLQRKKEIAVLKSLGASDASIMKIFVLVGVILGTGGALLGGAAGTGRR
ncbi:MAG: ABC transporter permease [Myxococcota bacterium]